MAFTPKMKRLLRRLLGQKKGRYRPTDKELEKLTPTKEDKGLSLEMMRRMETTDEENFKRALLRRFAPKRRKK